jgi:hypothetical protein
MLRRLILGLVFGLIVGGAVAFGLVQLGVASFASGGGEAFAYLSSAVAGALTGAVAGKPMWASGAKIEAGLKSFFGALLAVGAMFALQRWGAGITSPNVSALGGDGVKPVVELPMMSLPLIAGVLGALFGLDNTEEPAKDEPRARKRVAVVDAKASANASTKARAAEADPADDVEPAARRAKR